MRRTFLSNKMDSQAARIISGLNMESGTILISPSIICSDVLKSKLRDPVLNLKEYDKPQAGKIGVSQSVKSNALIDPGNSLLNIMVS